MSILLALDASSSACSVALWRSQGNDEGEVLSRFAITPREHTRRLMPMIDEVLAEAGLTFNALDALAYGRGPGSFTGLRIAAGTAQGLAFGLDKPLLGVSTLAALALAAHRRLHLRHVMPALDARMNELYVAAYRCDSGQVSLIGEEAVLPPHRLTLPAGHEQTDWVGVGSGWALWESVPLEVRDGISQHLDEWHPTAEEMVRLAAREYTEGAGEQAHLVQPVYLRDTVAWQKSR
ncbi:MULTISPECIES: tRNA (adenosine(37)-N6)-threonylcarbamoyltransferase complex dimerization subunit type 1 TsaB [Halomonadaceae]|uniref:tRNA (adenosine(37)-N6)-threonylcarbamoyltransferase complex dimerization subunit type 1 TsaB n=1 Tax=Halomonadaceae TaxID=28256 RepID=UPI00159AF5FD|nr:MULTISPECIES: tRNA (adenosine(37)-N6)-threonylcarbamoyltransferase complex dimerization subunit type 1 TsaB [Halomonas]QJQ96782.1 tRNA (adenosine(37)-N6)-threonylcarbamoyltransferase complex dimerization subunit type 1 TsaB [Halomonas sp. PA5]